MRGSNTILGGGGFHHVSMKVGDFEASVKFYTEVLGFEKSIAWGQGDQRAIMLDSGDGSCLEIFAGGKGEKKPEGILGHVALRTKDCRRVLEKVRSAGMEITMEPTDIAIPTEPATLITIAFFKGPDGEIVELFQNR